LKLKLSPAPERRTPSLPAYEAYLRYRYYQWRFTPEDSQRSKECLNQALALDPGFALPYVGLADYHLALAAVGLLPSREAMTVARELAMRALEIDPDLPEAHAMLGIVAGVLDFDWPETERRFRLAAREPISTHMRQWNAYFHLLSIGRPAEAKRWHDRVIEEDPLSQMWHYTSAISLLALGSDEAALNECRKSLELDPQFWVGWMLLGLIHALHGRHTESMQCAEKAVVARAPVAVGLMAAALVNTGRTEEAEPLLDELRSNTAAGPIGMAYYYLARGDMDGTVQWAGAAAEQRVASLVTILIRPFEPRLRTSPGWSALLKTLNLAPASTNL
jgi:serine/threonine-protein kinase